MIHQLLPAAALALAAVTAPAIANPVMTPEDCAAGWRAITDPLTLPRYLRAAGQIVTDDGWCRMDRTTAELRSYDFASLSWRATGVADAVAKNVPPQSFEAEFTGINWTEAFHMQFPSGQPAAHGIIRISARQDPTSQTLVLNELTFDFDTLGRLQFAGQGAGFDFSSLTVLQSSIGGMRLNRLSLDATLTAPLSKALYTSFAPVGGATPMLTNLVSAIPAAALPTDERIALGAFIDALPDATGHLAITAQSETGLGALQLGAGQASKARNAPLPGILSIMLSGVALSVDWAADD
ncbi:hypothetical protein N4R57_05125 [Rhodobacteraceae bacterium D3-12]|nr:hypothetical protein N4R57_05125 [Rhodobacteraceae bacterium D3-12]